MSARPATNPTRGSVAAIALTALLASLAAGVLHAQPASAQTEAERTGRAPMLTVTDATIERCGPVAITGTNFEPNEEVTVQVNGTTEDERPIADATGTFSFTTGVACEQTSGFLKIQASDGTTTVPIDLTIAPAPAPLAAGRAPAAADPSAFDDVATWSVRLVLIGLLAAELVVLWRRQSGRRARQARRQEAVTP